MCFNHSELVRTLTPFLIVIQPRDPCPVYPVTSYTFNITERNTQNFVTFKQQTENNSLVLNDTDGLVPNQIYQLIIEAANDVGSTVSDEILFCKYRYKLVTFQYCLLTIL